MRLETAPRARGGDYYNTSPITDIYEALAALEPEPGDSTDGRYIRVDSDGVELSIGWYRGGDSGGDASGHYYFQISPETVEELRKRGWVEVRKIPYFGGTRIERDKLELSNAGEVELKRYIDEQREIARKLPIPGEHTKFSGVFNNAGYGRDQYWFGALYFEFRTPMNERLRVYPSTKTVSKIE